MKPIFNDHVDESIKNQIESSIDLLVVRAQKENAHVTSVSRINGTNKQRDRLIDRSLYTVFDGVLRSTMVIS